MSEHHGSCHCGAIRLILREDPPDVGDCNCSLCRRIGGLWHHTTHAMVTVEAQGAVAYRQGDCLLDTWHCGTCGCTTHWTPTDDYPRMAVNLRMFEPELWHDLPRRFIDGASY